MENDGEPTGRGKSLAEALGMAEAADIEFDPPRIDVIFRLIELDGSCEVP